MQPYFMPYIGYFQLIKAVDTFVFYDDVNYIKQGWINRNQILMNNAPSLFTIPLENASSNLHINQVNISKDAYIRWRKKFFKSLMASYGRAPFYTSICDLMKKSLPDNTDNTDNISNLAINSIKIIMNYLHITTQLKISSELKPTNLFSGQDRVLEICKQFNAQTYINPIGGIELYSKNDFMKENINLYFIRTNNILYKQFTDHFTPNLSIIDVLMFNSPESINEILDDYTLI